MDEIKKFKEQLNELITKLRYCKLFNSKLQVRNYTIEQMDYLVKLEEVLETADNQIDDLIKEMPKYFKLDENNKIEEGIKLNNNDLVIMDTLNKVIEKIQSAFDITVTAEFTPNTQNEITIKLKGDLLECLTAADELEESIKSENVTFTQKDRIGDTLICTITGE